MMYTSTRTKGVNVSRTRNRRYNVQLGQTLFAIVIAIAMACTPSGKQNGGGAVIPPPAPFGNGAPTRTYVDSLTFSPDTSYVGTYPSCTTCSDSVTLKFEPLDTTFNVKWQPAVTAPNRGSVVARVSNTSNKTFAEGNFKLEPYSTSQQYAYAWIGHAKESDGTTDWLGFGVYTLNAAGVVTGEWSLVPPSKIKVCTANTHTRPAIHKMPPASTNCHYLAQNNSSIFTRLASLVMPKAYAATNGRTAIAVGGLGGLWISCSGGCCQVTTQ